MSRLFWVLKGGESVYTLCSRITLIIITWTFLRNNMETIASLSLTLFFLFRIISGLLFSKVTDHVNRRSILVTLCLAVIIALFVLIIAREKDHLVISALLSLIILGSVDGLFSATVTAVIPEVVSHENLEQAFRYSFFLQALINTLGLTVGLIGFQVLDYKTLLSIELFLLLCTFIIFLFIPKFTPHSSDEINSEKSVSILVTPLKTFRRFRLEVSWALISLVVNFFLVAFSSLLIPFHIGITLKLEPIYVGLIEGSLSLGMLVSAVFIHKWMSDVISRHIVVIISFFGICCCFAAYIFFQGPVEWAVISFILGIVIVTNNTTVEAARSVAIPKEVRGQVQTLHGIFIQAGVPVGIFLCGIAIHHNLTIEWLIISAVATLLITLLIAIHKELKILLRTKAEDLEGFYSKMYPLRQEK